MAHNIFVHYCCLLLLRFGPAVPNLEWVQRRQPGRLRGLKTGIGNDIRLQASISTQ